MALNAAIKVTRAETEGRGFSFVANEMGRLAKMNTDTAKKINNHLADMFRHSIDIIYYWTESLELWST